MRIKTLMNKAFNQILDYARLGMSEKQYDFTKILHVQLVYMAGLAAIVLSVLYAFFYYSVGLYLLTAIIVVSIAFFMVSLYVLKRYKAGKLISHICIVLVIGMILTANMMIGGFDNPSDSWFVVIIVVAGLLLNQTAYAVYIFVVFAIIIGFFWVKKAGIEIPIRLSAEDLDLVNLTNRLGSVVSVIYLVALFRYERETRESWLKNSKDKLKDLAERDKLTWLHNRNYFLSSFQQKILKYPNEKQALLFIDLDAFKVVNDSFGHNVGDELLIQVAARFRQHLDPEDLICRHGGDEFLVMPRISDYDEYTEMMSNKIIQMLNQPFVIRSQTLHIGCSIGIAYYPEHGKDCIELLKAADIAMSRAKSDGSEQYRVYDESLAADIDNKNKLAIELRSAIDENKLSVVYQPKYSADGRDVLGYEALCRWRDNDNNAIPPNLFIRVAEEFSLINKLGDWLVSTVAKQISEWKRAGKKVCKVAVNISAKQLLKNGFAEDLLRLINHYDIDPSFLELELTESLFIETSNDTLSKLRKLNDLGFSLVIDDYGTGYASLGYLKGFPISGIKIDKSFIDDLAGSEVDRAIVASTIELANKLGLKVTAEGVETVVQLNFLREMKCDEIQGYYFSRPIDADEIAID